MWNSVSLINLSIFQSPKIWMLIVGSEIGGSRQLLIAVIRGGKDEMCRVSIAVEAVDAFS